MFNLSLYFFQDNFQYRKEKLVFPHIDLGIIVKMDKECKKHGSIDFIENNCVSGMIVLRYYLNKL